jgi:hypothetical protein
MELFHMFLQRGASLLTAGGYVSFIVPTTLLNNVYAEDLRAWLTDRCVIGVIAVARGRVFAHADVHTSVIVLRRENDRAKREANSVLASTALDTASSGITPHYSAIKQERLLALPGRVWNVLVNESNAHLLDRIGQGHTKLGDVAAINRGLITGDRDKYFSKRRATRAYEPVATGSDVQRYHVAAPSEYVLFERPDTAGGCWDAEVHHAPHKLVIRQIGYRPTASILRKPLAVTGNIFTIRAGTVEDELYLLGLLNSRLIEFYWKVMFTDFKSSFPQVTLFSISQIPIRTADRKQPADKARYDKMVELVESMLKLHKDLPKAKTPHETESIHRRIAATDKQIDTLVYELYGLTEEDVQIAEKVPR